MTLDPSQAPETLRISSESLANGRCDNCYKPIYRLPGKNEYIHRHNHHVECRKTQNNPLLIKPLIVHDGESNIVILMMLVKKVALLITNFNALVLQFEENKKEKNEIVPIKDSRFERSYIGSKPSVAKKQVIVFGQIVPLTADQVSVYRNKTHGQEITAELQRSFLIQWKWFCRCVAPKPTIVTGPNPAHFELCLNCKKPIVEDDRD